MVFAEDVGAEVFAGDYTKCGSLNSESRLSGYAPMPCFPLGNQGWSHAQSVSELGGTSRF